jgi:hypothetical protein
MDFLCSILYERNAHSDILRESGGNIVKRVITNIRPSETLKGSVKLHMLVNIQT